MTIEIHHPATPPEMQTIVTLIIELTLIKTNAYQKGRHKLNTIVYFIPAHPLVASQTNKRSPNLELATMTPLISSHQIYRTSQLKYRINSMAVGERVATGASPAQVSKKIYTTPA
jgi:hypothetical protein